MTTLIYIPVKNVFRISLSLHPNQQLLCLLNKSDPVRVLSPTPPFLLPYVPSLPLFLPHSIPHCCSNKPLKKCNELKHESCKSYLYDIFFSKSNTLK